MYVGITYIFGVVASIVDGGAMFVAAVYSCLICSLLSWWLSRGWWLRWI